jgi:hypothetical protein
MDVYWRAPGYQPNHDYDPLWDYIILENAPEGMMEKLDQAWEKLSQIPAVEPYLVAAAKDLPSDSVAIYCDGTSQAPVIVVDWEAIGGDPDEIALTLLHELRHAQQDMEQEHDIFPSRYDEDDAESWAREQWDSLGGGYSL